MIAFNLFHCSFLQLAAIMKFRQCKEFYEYRLLSYLLTSIQLCHELHHQSLPLSLSQLFQDTKNIQRLLEHLKEATLYSTKDLESASHTLTVIEETLRHGEENQSSHLLVLLENRLVSCRIILYELQLSLVGLSPELTHVHERLISILRSISAANTRQKACQFLDRLDSLLID